jgi:hypothetical protein
MYKCNTSFKSLNGKTYLLGQLISFDEYYQLLEKERKYFFYHQSNQVKIKEDRIR